MASITPEVIDVSTPIVSADVDEVGNKPDFPCLSPHSTVDEVLEVQEDINTDRDPLGVDEDRNVDESESLKDLTPEQIDELKRLSRENRDKSRQNIAVLRQPPISDEEKAEIKREMERTRNYSRENLLALQRGELTKEALDQWECSLDEADKHDAIDLTLIHKVVHQIPTFAVANETEELTEEAGSEESKRRPDEEELTEEAGSEESKRRPDEEELTEECQLIVEKDWRDIPEVDILVKREGGDALLKYLEDKDYLAYTTSMAMYRQYMVDGFGKIGTKTTAKLINDESLLDGMSEGVAIKICTIAGILPGDGEDIRPYLRLYLEHIGYDADSDYEDDILSGQGENDDVETETVEEKDVTSERSEDERKEKRTKETICEKAQRLWQQTGRQQTENPDVNSKKEELLETGECLKGLLELLDEGEGFILPDHINKVTIFLSHINAQDEDLFEVVQYVIGNNIEQPLPEHLQERCAGTEEEIEEGRKIVEALTVADPDASIQNQGNCVIC